MIYITDKDLLSSTGDSPQYFVITHKDKNLKKKKYKHTDTNVCVYMKLIHCELNTTQLKIVKKSYETMRGAHVLSHAHTHTHTHTSDYTPNSIRKSV